MGILRRFSGTVVRLLFYSIAATITLPISCIAGGNDTLPHLNTFRFELDTIDGLVSNEREIRAGLLYDLDRGKIVWEKDMDYAYPIASLTKMMVGLLAMEDINAGKVCLDDKITVKRTYRKKVRRRRYTNYTVEEHYTLEDLLKMALVASHNESTVWIAKHCSGELAAFVERMNKRCMELGMTKTQYSNPSGLPAIIDELDNSSSPRDQLILALEVLKHPKLMEITAIPYANVYNGKGHVNYRNHNGLVINYQTEVDGIKTGFTKAAGFCLTATAKRGDRRLISIVFGCRSPWIRNGLVANMMNSYFDAIKLGRLGESSPDMSVARAFMDSVNTGLAQIRPEIEARKIVADAVTEDESYAYTYKTVTQKVRKSHTVRKGESLGKIADRYNVGLSELKKWNKLKSTVIRPGQKLYVYSTVKKRIPVKLVVDPEESIADLQPAADSTDSCETTFSSEHATTAKPQNTTLHLADTSQKNAPSAAANPTAQKRATESSRYIYYTVQPGDTLWNIAQRYQSNIDQLKKLNNISRKNHLRSGIRIKIPLKGS